jgi:hypothetical protein
MAVYEDANQISKEAVDNAMKSFSAVAKGFQQIATETTDFTKRSYEHSAQTFEKLVQARSVEKVIEVQNDYATSAYQAWVAQAQKLGEIYADIAKETYKPFESTISKAASSATEFGRKAASQAEDFGRKAAAQADETLQQAH